MFLLFSAVNYSHKQIEKKNTVYLIEIQSVFILNYVQIIHSVVPILKLRVSSRGPSSCIWDIGEICRQNDHIFPVFIN